MTNQRLSRILSDAKRAQTRLHDRGYIRRSTLPYVTLEEHHWLSRNMKSMSGFVRTFDYEDDVWIEDPNRPVQAREPKITEIWVGARSMGTVGGESPETETEGLSASQLDQEDSAELTDLQSYLYDDPTAFETWIEAEITRRLTAWERPIRNVIYRSAMRREIMLELPTDKEGDPIMAMIEDPTTGEPRPIRNGDVIQVCMGSKPIVVTRRAKDGRYRKFAYELTQDLDATYLEEADDPRHQNDASAAGSDHKWSDRFRANSDLEQEFLTDNPGTGPKTLNAEGEALYRHSFKVDDKDNPGYRIPNTAAPDIRWQPDDLTLSRIAQEMAEKIHRRSPDQDLFELIDSAKARLRAMTGDIKFAGNMQIGGYFISKQEFFATLEGYHMEWEAEQKRHIIVERKFEGDERPRRFAVRKLAPSAVDWDQVAKASGREPVAR